MKTALLATGSRYKRSSLTKGCNVPWIANERKVVPPGNSEKVLFRLSDITFSPFFSFYYSFCNTFVNVFLFCYSTFVMQKELHPTYHNAAKITCSCGQIYTIGSTKETMHIEICSACHPFYTGNDKVLDTAGRVERFKARLAKKDTAKPAKKTRAAKA